MFMCDAASEHGRPAPQEEWEPANQVGRWPNTLSSPRPRALHPLHGAWHDEAPARWAAETQADVLLPCGREEPREAGASRPFSGQTSTL